MSSTPSHRISSIPPCCRSCRGFSSKKHRITGAPVHFFLCRGPSLPLRTGGIGSCVRGCPASPYRTSGHLSFCQLVLGGRLECHHMGSLVQLPFPGNFVPDMALGVMVFRPLLDMAYRTLRRVGLPWYNESPLCAKMQRTCHLCRVGVGSHSDGPR